MFPPRPAPAQFGLTSHINAQHGHRWIGFEGERRQRGKENAEDTERNPPTFDKYAVSVTTPFLH